MSKFTPGPWKQIVAQPGTMLEIVNENHVYVCSLIGGEDKNKQPNARLISAAPDMYYLLVWAIRRIELANQEGNPILSAWLPEAKEILRKATE